MTATDTNESDATDPDLAARDVSSRALWFVGERAVELRDETLRPTGAGQVVVRGLASGVSQGTELLLYRGEGPVVFDPSLGDASPETYPRRYGYAWVGEVEAQGTSLHGARVFGLLPHGEAHVVDASRLSVLDAAIPPTRAVLFANLETAITIAWDAEVALGERVVVLGGGVVGILAAWLLQRSGAWVTLVEKSEARRRAGDALLGEGSCATHLDDGDLADVVVEATGDPRSLDLAIAWARPEGRIVVASFYGSRRAPVDLGDRFHRGRLTLRSSQVSEIPPRLRSRWDHARRGDLVRSLLNAPALDALIAPPVPFGEAAALYAELDREDDLPPAHVFVYR